MDFFYICGFIAVIAVLVVVGIAVSAFYEKKRREALEKVSAELGLEFYPQGISGLLESTRAFAQFREGRGHTVTNTIRGVTDDVELTIFDFTYTTGSGKHSHTHRQTMICFASQRLSVPEFSVTPEHFFHKVAKLFGMKDINFAEDPAFSSAFILQGGHEGAVRQMFTGELRLWFAQRSGSSATGRGSQVFFFRAGQRVNPDKIAGLLEEGLQFFKLVAAPAVEP